MKPSSIEDHGAHSTPRSHHPNGTPGGREDAWSEGATSALVDAWGDRYLQLSRGNLRRKDWKEVADAVNSRQGGVKPRKTDIQCKNRIDTLKKKYKLEKSKLAPSKWPFFSRLDSLVGNTAPVSVKPPVKTPTSVTFTVKPPGLPALPALPAPAACSGGSSSKSRLNSRGTSDSSRGGNDDDDDVVAFDGASKKQQQRRRRGDGEAGDGGVLRELARAILKFGEIYERIESSKQQQVMELERQRMEFAKELEFQRMQMFMEAQLEMQKLKRPKYNSGSGKKL